MKRLISAAAFVAATALIPVTSATAVPVGTQSACAVATQSGTASCNFLGSGTAWEPPSAPTSDNVGYGGYSSGAWSITHKQKHVVTAANGCVTGYSLVTAIDVSGAGGSGPSGGFYGSEDTIPGVVYTLSITGPGQAQAGGRSTSPSATEPTAPGGTNFAGAEDKTNGKQIGDGCS